MSNVRTLWFASPDFRASGRWKPKTPFYLEAGSTKVPAKPKHCHILYRTPIEALVACREHLIERFRIGAGSVFIQMYKVRVHVPFEKYLIAPEQVETYGFFDDHDLTPRFLCTTHQLFERVAWLKVKGPRYSKEKFDFWYRDAEDLEAQPKYMMPEVSIEVEHRFMNWASMPLADLMEKHFDLINHDWNCDITMLPHNPKLMEKKRDRSNSLGQQGQTDSTDREADSEIQEDAEGSGT